MNKKNYLKYFSIFMAVVMIVLSLPIPMISNAAVKEDVPPKMQYNHVLDSLQYLGYNVKKLKEDGHLFQEGYDGSVLVNPNDKAKRNYGIHQILSPLGYDESYKGIETTTVNGKIVPDKQKWINSGGLNCASFISYYYLNYLPNVAGLSGNSTYKYIKSIIDNKIKNGWNYQADWTWQSAFDEASSSSSNKGYITKINAMDYYKEKYKINSGNTPSNLTIAKYLNDNSKDYRINYLKHLSVGTKGTLLKLGELLNPGDLVVMGHYDSADGDLRKIVNGDNQCFSHVGIYIGDYNGHSFIAHCTGGAEGFRRDNEIIYHGEKMYMGRGVEIATIEDVFNREANLRSYPVEFYKLNFPKQYGCVEINNTDELGNKLQGTSFELTNTDTNFSFTVTANANGKVLTNEIPYGKYTIKATSFPTGYKAGSIIINGKVINADTTAFTLNTSTFKIDFKNVLKSVDIYGFACKVGENGKLYQIADVKIGLFSKNIIDKYKKEYPNAKYEDIYSVANAIKVSTTGNVVTPYNEIGKIGCYRFDNIKYGSYVIAEIEAPKGFVKPDEGTIRTITINDKSYSNMNNGANGRKILQINNKTTIEKQGPILNYPFNDTLTLLKDSKLSIGYDEVSQKKYLMNVNANTTAGEIKGFFSNNEMLQVTDTDGKSVSDNDKIGSRYCIQLIFDGKIIDEITVVVMFDINGDTLVNAKDLTMLRKYYVGDYEIELFEYACEANGDGNIDFKDISLLRRYIAGWND